MAMDEMKDKDTFWQINQHLVICVKMAAGEKADALLVYEP